MAGIARSFHDLNRMETLSLVDSPVHRVDPRAKLATFAVFAACVVSFGKYEISPLIPYFLFPAVTIPLARIPVRYLAGKVALLLPFAALMGIFNPLYDRDVLLVLGGLPITGGMVSFLSILLRSALTVTAALTLIAVTGFTGICAALERFGAPRVFTTQLLMLYRYLFVLTAEAGRMTRARDLRTVRRRGSGLKASSSLMGHLLLRTFDRAQRIHMAMMSRCWQGGFFPRKPMRFTLTDLGFFAGWSATFILMRFVDVPEAAGQLIMGALP